MAMHTAYLWLRMCLHVLHVLQEGLDWVPLVAMFSELAVQPCP